MATTTITETSVLTNPEGEAGAQVQDVSVLAGPSPSVFPPTAPTLRLLSTPLAVLQEETEEAVSLNASTTERNVLNLVVAAARYKLRSLFLKCVNPGAETVTVRLYLLVNDVLTEVDSFTITTDNYTTYHSLMDMFGLPQLAGDSVKVTVESSGGLHAITGQYSYATAY